MLWNTSTKRGEIVKKAINIYVYKEMKYILGKKATDQFMLDALTEDEREIVMRRVDEKLNLGLYDEYGQTFLL
jgi:hypothetical protein